MGRRVLYIDDDAGIRRLVERALTRRGYDVTVADGGEAGVAAARAGGFDLAAVDHYMPGIDGLETMAQLMQLPSPPAIVYVTGSEETRVAGAGAGRTRSRTPTRDSGRDAPEATRPPRKAKRQGETSPSVTVPLKEPLMPRTRPLSRSFPTVATPRMAPPMRASAGWN